jgi:dTDP-4-dehydrorhamnose reductase
VTPRLELWGGIECTVNRVGEQYFDQLVFSGHAGRIDDLDRLHQIGLRTLRYPIIWEQVAPNDPNQLDWRWADERMARFQRLGMDPIVGLVHHGSGPRYTSLADPAFPEKLAHYARQVATRYPWVTRYTPVNEPLTTARFAGLYGHWYPHAKDARTFLALLLNECRGIALAMKAIREVRPDAQLVLTEDLGQTQSTPLLSYQASFENERRWLSMDLLAGKVVPGHILWSWFQKEGIDQSLLDFFMESPCLPDVFGINHYLTSNRYIDEDCEKYPEWSRGGNDWHRYADVEAVRVGGITPTSRMDLLRQTWKRYRRPVAITEAHLFGPREEQMRWLHEACAEANTLRSQGVDVCAVTAWSLLGSYDWVCLVTRCDGVYESGAYDLRSPSPRPTALAPMIQGLATEGAYRHPVLATPGWWARPSRALYPPAEEVEDFSVPLHEKGDRHPILITGGRGTLGKAFARICQRRGLYHTVVVREDLELSDSSAVKGVLDRLKPWAVINAAGYVRVDEAERDRTACHRDNVWGPVALATACADRQVPLVTFSSDLVFDGASQTPYVESSPVQPLNLYGWTKVEAEARVRAIHAGALVIRTSAFFGPWDTYNFVTQALQSLSAGEAVFAPDDVLISPTYVPDLVNHTLDLLIDGERGIWHLANEGSVSWAGLARKAADLADLDTSLVIPRPSTQMGWTARRPHYSVLSSERGRVMPTLDRALEAYWMDLERKGVTVTV